nr:nadh-dependent flavin oxidoreductase nada [Quercus suber]
MTRTQTELETVSQTAISLISQPLTLPCGLTLPNRLVKCPMQETLAEGPWFDPPDTFRTLYKLWAESQYGLIITGQVQIDRRFLSIAGDVCCHERSLAPEILAKWTEWARVAQKDGTPCIVQLAHPGRMSPADAGIRPRDMRPLCASEVPLRMGDGWVDKYMVEKTLGTPKAMSVEEIDEVVDMFKNGALVAKKAGFAGIQIHGAHGFLISQFLSPRTNKRSDEYGGSPEKRMKLLRRLVHEIRAMCPAPFCVSVKLNSADYMDAGEGLEMDEGLAQVRWLRTCGEVDFVEISGGNAEQKSSGLHNSFARSLGGKGQQIRASTRIREGFFTDFAERVMAMELPAAAQAVPVQLSGGFRTRTGMADAIYSRTCDLIGLGRAAVLEPTLPRSVLLNPAFDDADSGAQPHLVKGQWFARMIPIKVVGAGLPIQFFYYNMRRLGKGLRSDPDASIPFIVLLGFWSTLRDGVTGTLQKVLAACGGGAGLKEA